MKLKVAKKEQPVEVRQPTEEKEKDKIEERLEVQPQSESSLSSLEGRISALEKKLDELGNRIVEQMWRFLYSLENKLGGHAEWPSPSAPVEERPTPEAKETEEAAEKIAVEETREEPAAEAAEETAEETKVSAKKAEEPEDILSLAEEAAEERQRLSEARKRAYDNLIAAAKAAGVFIDPNEEIEVEGRTMRSITYLLGRVFSGEETPEEAVEEAIALGWASSYLGASPEAYHALIQAAQEAGLWILKRIYLPDGRELRPISELAKKVEAGAISAAEAVELARKAGWTRSLRRPAEAENLNEEIPNGGGLATIGEQLEVKNNLQQQWAEANRRKEEATKAQQNAGGGKKKKNKR